MRNQERKIPEVVQEFLKFAFKEAGLKLEQVRTAKAKHSYGWFCSNGKYVLVRPYCHIITRGNPYCRISFNVDSGLMQKLALLVIYQINNESEDYWIIPGDYVRARTKNFLYKSINVSPGQMNIFLGKYQKIEEVFTSGNKKPEEKKDVKKLVKLQILRFGSLEARTEDGCVTIMSQNSGKPEMIMSGSTQKIKEHMEEIKVLMENI